MRYAVLAWLVVLAASCGRSAGPAGKPEQLSKAAADSLLKAYAKDRADTQSWLRDSTTSYLATVERHDFGDSTSVTIGSGPGNSVQIVDPDVRPHHVRVTVVGDSFQVQALDPKAHFRWRGAEMTSATLPPSAIQIARFVLRLSHQRYPAIIVFDPKSPRFAEYKGIQYFPPNLGYRFVAALTPNAHQDTTIILSTRGNKRRALRVGHFDFDVNGTPCRLEANRLLEPGVGEKDISLFFTDATTGKESYTVGRYLEPQPRADGLYTLDFNECYNPACAYSEHYNCPIPPSENHLTVAIAAGEQNAHYLH